MSFGALANRAKSPISATTVTAVSNWTPRKAWSAFNERAQAPRLHQVDDVFRQRREPNRRVLDRRDVVDEHSIVPS
jgi:hypothetical protein